MQCYCKSGLKFSECCEPILSVLEVAPSALALMRSRYSAYCVGDVLYLQATTHDHSWSDEELKFIQDWADNSFWQHLEIIDFGEEMVEFKAYYIFEGKQHVHHEKSSFLKVNDMWKYVDGEIYNDKVNFLRNEKCICGSGEKYKRCCFKKLNTSSKGVNDAVLQHQTHHHGTVDCGDFRGGKTKQLDGCTFGSDSSGFHFSYDMDVYRYKRF